MGDDRCRSAESRERPRLERLEAIRGAAAVYVFAHHVVRVRLGIHGGPLGILFAFGQEAVLLFFLLSGFVIFYSVSGGTNKSFPGYFRRRWLRLYPIYVLALLVSAVSDGAVSWPTHWKQLLGNLVMLQDVSVGKPGNWVETFGGNWPLWSLSYEWWFYMMFYPVYRYIRPSRQQGLAFAISLVGMVFGLFWANPISRFAAYFFIWWAGVELARAYLRNELPSLRSQWRSFLGLAVLAFVESVPLLSWLKSGRSLSWGLYPVLELRHFAAALLWLSVAIIWAHARWAGFSATIGWCRFVAPISYGLYVFHFPIAISSRWVSTSLPFSMQVAVPICATVLVAWLAETQLQAGVMKLFRSKGGVGIVSRGQDL